MKLTDSATHLNTVVNGLETHILPELTSKSAISNAEYLRKILLELSRREQQYLDALPEIITRGIAIAEDLRQPLLAAGRNLAPPQLDDQCSVDSFNQVSAYIAQLSLQLRQYSPIPAERLELIRKGVQWEADAHNALSALEPKVEIEDDAPPLTEEALESFIQSEHPDGQDARLTAFDRIMGGYGKQTWGISVTDAAGNELPLIVRKCEKVPTCHHEIFDLRREFDLLARLSETDFPAPKPLWYAENVPGSDAPFYVMQKLPGSPPGSFLGAAGDLPDAVVFHYAELLAELHSMPLTEMSDFIDEYESRSLHGQTMAQCNEAALRSWRSYAEESGLLNSVTINYIFDWLEQHVPDDDSAPSLVHGDFSVHNTLTDNGKVTAVLDWEVATFGSPLIDLTYIKPKVEAQMDWEVFLGHYESSGGPPVRRQDETYYQVYHLMYNMVAMNQTVDNIQAWLMKDPRFTMFELEFLPQFMREVLRETADEG